MFDSQQDTITLDQFHSTSRQPAERGSTMMAHDGGRDVETTPPGYSSAQTEFGVVAIGKQVFVETANLVQHGVAVHGRAAVGPDRRTGRR